MDSYIIASTKEFTWDCAHLLAGHKGLCQNLHGHTYKMEVTAVQQNGDVLQEGPSAGMVVDFKDLKNVVKEVIVDPLDHATIIDISSDDQFEAALFHLLKAHNKKIAPLQYRPTAENMAIHFLAVLNEEIEKRGLDFVVVKIRVYETPTSYAEVMS